jgi:hypothetical protein
MSRGWDPAQGYVVDACGGCGHEWPVRDGYLESCVQTLGAMRVLQLCPDCRKAMTVQEALDKLTGDAEVERVSLWDTIQDLLHRLQKMEKKLRQLRGE